MAKKKIIEVEDLNRDMPKYPDQRLKFTLPVPPSVNHMYINAGRGKRLNKEATQYIKTAQNICKKAIKQQKWKRDKEHVWYVMDLYYYFPDKMRRDSHNTLKILTDCLEGLLYSDDYYLLPRIQYVTLDRENPRLEIVYYSQEGNDDDRHRKIA